MTFDSLISNIVLQPISLFHAYSNYISWVGTFPFTLVIRKMNADDEHQWLLEEGDPGVCPLA